MKLLIAELVALVSASNSDISMSHTPATSIEESLPPSLEMRSVNHETCQGSQRGRF